MGSRIGKGAQSEVYEGRFGQRQVALKIYSLNLVQNRGKYVVSKHHAEFERECRIFSAVTPLQPDNIVAFVGTAELNGHKILVMERLPRALSDSIAMKEAVSLSLRLQQLRDVAEGVCFLNAQNWLFVDIKPSNILLTHEQRCKLTDFGISEPLGRIGMLPYDPSCFYLPPELSGYWVADDGRYEYKVLSTTPLTSQTDSYGLGYLTSTMMYEFLGIQCCWEIQDGKIHDFDTLHDGGRYHRQMIVHQLPKLRGRVRTDGPFGSPPVQKAMKEQLIRPVMHLVPQSRISPAEYLEALKSLQKRFCEARARGTDMG
ncbi:protein kinase [Parendozoicomonas haliclonae]|uniref:Protein kinase domain protein n=2 Tax=Parendozoicomonas haliclonae TaxID=1960125 RepID=A0A1X7AIK0_9GAMM|nr:Protein kinase domain protein [Parendozoicomonas haliclonae]